LGGNFKLSALNYSFGTIEIRYLRIWKYENITSENFKPALFLPLFIKSIFSLEILASVICRLVFVIELPPNPFPEKNKYLKNIKIKSMKNILPKDFFFRRAFLF